MAVTTTRTQKQRVPGNQKFTVTSVTFDSSYAEGGEPLTAAQLGLTKVDFAMCNLTNGTEASEKWVMAPFYTPSTSKIHLQDAKTGKELAKEVNCEKVTVTVVAFGR